MAGIFGIIGGDQRQLFLAKSIAVDGYPVLISCLENAKEKDGLRACSIKELVKMCDVIILPLPVSKDGKYLNTPLSKASVELNEEFAESLRGKAVYGGLMNRLYQASEIWNDLEVYDYYTREELMAGNAVLTAEGAIGLAINEFPGALNGSSCLVTGFGRIGKALCFALRGLCANVDCAARKKSDLANIRSIGCQPVEYRNIVKKYDIIFNTVPAMVLTAAQLSKQSRETVIIELASVPPGGIDLETAERLKIKVISGQSIPGRVSPKTSGEYIKEAIYNMMEEL